MFPRLPPRLPPLSAWLASLILLLVPAAQAQSDVAGVSAGSHDIIDLLDRLPNMNPFGQLGDHAPFPIRYYVRPRLGDFFHRDYVRVTVGGRAKITDNFDVHSEVEGYFTSGFKDSAGYGLDRVRLGSKYEEEMGTVHPYGWSTGIDFDTPVSRPPMELTDGHSHLIPYVAASTTIRKDCNLVGFAGFGADFLAHTELPANFGRNQLHTNSLVFTTGLTRDWKRFRVAVTGTWNTGALLSNEGRNVLALRSDFLIPLVRKPGPTTRTHFLLVIGGRAVNGPDGTELGATGSLRIEFAGQSGKSKH